MKRGGEVKCNGVSGFKEAAENRGDPKVEEIKIHWVKFTVERKFSPTFIKNGWKKGISGRAFSKNKCQINYSYTVV